MTRTERNQYPAALLKDRHSRSGLATEKEVQRKKGAGAHNWGAFSEENDMEAAANRDAFAEAEADGMFDMEDGVAPLPDAPGMPDGVAAALKTDTTPYKTSDDVISTSPTESMSSLESLAPTKGRRMSNVSDEERERARLYREGIMHKGHGHGRPSLTNIARTSYGIATSPPTGLATSPTKAISIPK